MNNRKLDYVKLGGAEAYFSLYQTPDVGQFQFSSGLIKVAAGDDFIKAGWTVRYNTIQNIFYFIHFNFPPLFI